MQISQTQPKKHFNISSLFSKMQEGIEKFYSSKQSANHTNVSCICAVQRQQRDLQDDFYRNQLQLISQSMENLLEKQAQESLVFIKFLAFMKQYLQKILFLLGRKTLCDCKNKMLSDSILASHKVSFLREENDKFFKLYEGQAQECQQLKGKLKVIRKEQENSQEKLKISASDTSPICHLNFCNPSMIDLGSMNFSKETLKVRKSNIHKLSIESEEYDSREKSDTVSLSSKAYSSRISSQVSGDQQRHVIKDTASASHQKYFKEHQLTIITKKSRLFNNDYSHQNYR